MVWRFEQKINPKLKIEAIDVDWPFQKLGVKGTPCRSKRLWYHYCPLEHCTHSRFQIWYKTGSVSQHHRALLISHFLAQNKEATRKSFSCSLKRKPSLSVSSLKVACYTDVNNKRCSFFVPFLTNNAFLLSGQWRMSFRRKIKGSSYVLSSVLWDWIYLWDDQRNILG